MKVTAIELLRVGVSLTEPFRTSFGTESERDVLLVRVITPEAEGWGECVAGKEPLYSSEYVDSAEHVIRNFLLPRLAALEDVTAAQLGTSFKAIRGYPMAKAAIEMAVLDAELRAAGLSFGGRLGAVKARVPAGVSIGIAESVQQLLVTVARFVDAGYVRVKLKIEPGWDVEPVREVREHFGADLMLQVDANAAYTLADERHLAKLDEFGLLLIEQPLAEDDLRGHATLAKQISTPICLDESVTSARAAAAAIALSACSVVNIKPGRVGGYLEAVRVHDVCVANGIPVWCGGMLETGLGRAANIALAALPGFTLPGDVSASDRYYREDITPPFVLEEGHVTVPTGPGLGVEPLPDVLTKATRSRERLPM